MIMKQDLPHAGKEKINQRREISYTRDRTGKGKRKAYKPRNKKDTTQSSYDQLDKEDNVHPSLCIELF
jgi:hypothetical protein